MNLFFGGGGGCKFCHSVAGRISQYLPIGSGKLLCTSSVNQRGNHQMQIVKKSRNLYIGRWDKLRNSPLIIGEIAKFVNFLVFAPVIN